MRKLLLILIMILMFPQTAMAVEYTAPVAPATAEKYMPPETDSFIDGAWFVIKSAIQELNPTLVQAGGSCLSIVTVAMLVGIVKNYGGISARLVGLVGVVSLGVVLFSSSNSLIRLGAQTIEQLSDYAKLLLSVMTAAAAACGATATSSAIYSGTMVFMSVISTIVGKLVIPLIYVLIMLGIADAATGEKVFCEMTNFIKWLLTMILKISIYIFTGYMGITSVISGSVDSVAVKATKLTISSVVPVVGGIISDASETILLSAKIMRNSVGIYGMIALIACCIGPFLKIAVHYLLLKLTTSVSSAFTDKQGVDLLKCVGNVMELIMAAMGVVTLVLLVSVVCLIRSLS